MIVTVVYVSMYAVAGLWLGATVLFYPPGNLFTRWCESRRTTEAQSIACALVCVLWPIVLVTLVGLFFKWLINPALSAPGALWKGLVYVGRGIRDLLPERKAELPRAIVKK